MILNVVEVAERARDKGDNLDLDFDLDLDLHGRVAALRKQA